MLFGEYSLMVGSKALVIPFERFSGKWIYDAVASTANTAASHNELKTYCNHLASQPSLRQIIDVDLLQNALSQGLYFESDIPQGYGCGSSGALVAALYNDFAFEKVDQDIETLQKQLAQLESYFHGSSSGLDPLCCKLYETLLVNDFQVKAFSGELKLFRSTSVYLIDTLTVAKTGPLVKYFNDQLLTYSFYKKVKNKLIPSVNDAVDAVIEGKTAQLFDSLYQLSQFQFEYMKPMIPENQYAVWKKGLDSGDYLMKLCGSGGGGYLLVFAKEDVNLLRHFENQELIKLSDNQDKV